MKNLHNKLKLLGAGLFFILLFSSISTCNFYEVCHDGETITVYETHFRAHLLHGDRPGICSGMDGD